LREVHEHSEFEKYQSERKIGGRGAGEEELNTESLYKSEAQERQRLSKGRGQKGR
jgi:hypothetical protein